MDHFKDYFWYLLSSPFKMVKKAKNQWWIWFKVMGAWFDEVKEDLQRARDETTIATCSDIMLKYHGENCGPDGITQYQGESNDSYRSRIAMYDETERLGGTRDGIILAVNSLGYEDVEHIWMPRYNGDWDRWAEFIIVINEDIANPMPTSNENLIREVRDKKESVSKDNYLINYRAHIWNRLIVDLDTTYFMEYSFVPSDLDLRFDCLATVENKVSKMQGMSVEYTLKTETSCIEEMFAETDLFAYYWHGRRLDGTRRLDGSENLDAVIGKVEYVHDNIFDVYTVCQASGNIG